MTKYALASALLACLILGAPKVRSDELPTRKIALTRMDSLLYASLDYRDVIDGSLQKKLTSGLPTRIVTQINLERHQKNKPLSYWARSVSIVYDLWEEVFVVTVEDPQGQRRTKVSTAEQAVGLACRVDRSAVAHLGELPEGVYRLRVSIEVNPVSKEMVEKIRHWLARPPGGGEISQGSFFGSFVGIFVDRQIGQADRTSTFVSQWFRVGAR